MVTLNSAYKALRDARTSIRDLSSARDLEEAERHWKRFLDALIKIEKKVQVAVSDLPGGEGWFGQWQGQRKTELLSYCLHARNCDGHRIEEITAPEALVRIQGTGATHLRSIVWTPDRFEMGFTGSVPAESFVHRLRLLAVIDRGVDYEPPPEAQGPHPTPIHELAEQAANSMEALIQEAEQRFLP